MVSKLDVILLKLHIPITSQHFSSSSPKQSPPLPSLSMSTLPPCSTPKQPRLAPLLAPLPMPPASLCPTPVQPSHAPLPAPLPMLAPHLLDPAPHAKPWENRDIALLVMGPEFYGTAMVSCKCQPANFALWTVAKQGLTIPPVSPSSYHSPRHLETPCPQGIGASKIE
ncbi:hypothetical protein HKD37_07G018736 [Glycine soja]